MLGRQSPNGRVCNDCLDLVERFDATEAQQKEQVLVLKSTEVRRNPRIPLRRDCCVVCNVSTAAVKQEGKRVKEILLGPWNFVGPEQTVQKKSNSLLYFGGISALHVEIFGTFI